MPAEMPGPLGVKGKTGFPHAVQRGVAFGSPVQPGEEDGNAKHHEQLMLHVPPELPGAYAVQMEAGKAFFRHQNLMVIPLGHDALLHRLVRPPDPVAVEVDILINQPLHIGQGPADHQVVLIENMLWQRLPIILSILPQVFLEFLCVGVLVLCNRNTHSRCPLLC